MRLIDADKATKILHTILDPLANKKLIWLAWDVIFEDCETIDAVEVVRCKDCHFCGEIDENGWHCCENFGVGMPKNGFCSDAERREDVKVN